MASYNYIPVPYNHSPIAIDEHRWLSLVQSALSETINEEDDKVKVQVCIFFVPKGLFFLKPEAFMPQLFAIGPYHHWVPHLYDMERYKLAAARKIQCDLNSLSLEELVCCLLKHEQRIRSYYHKYLDFTGETLAWMMVIDASFLLDFLRNFIVDVEAQKGKQKISQWETSRMKMAYNMVIRDIIMLENQMPFFLLRKILRRCRQFSSPKLAEEQLSQMLLGFVKEVSPFNIIPSITSIDVNQYDHLLQLLYFMIVPKVNEEELFDQPHEIDLTDVLNSEEEDGEKSVGSMWKMFNSVWNYASNVNKGATIETIKKVLIKGPIKILIKLPWNILTSFPGISIIKQPVESLLCRGSVKEKDDDDVVPDGKNSISKPPLVEEITIPSVTELTDAGVRFMPSNGDLTTIRFDMQQKPATIYLPKVSLDINTEVVLRNLVAYETSAEPGPMVFTRYTELMNGIIDTEEDVKILREKGIIVNRMKSDKEVADLWNGMSRSVRLSKVEFMDKFLEDVNSYYNSRWKVKSKRCISKYVFGSWQFLTLLAAVALLLLTCLQAFCNVYSCGKRWFYVKEE
ncbi:hypothetical protein M5K25_014296 [Dendrobium thyrsiflorum]|uniref:Uncharacterized protein n=1 Tax=Dendrobium thyrsiflorum TaxID=117978 RepID=A0ABD0UWD8_DENTH